MAFRIAECVERGWLDASEPGRISGEIWVRGREQPLRLDLEGYPMADLAGRMLSFENPNPQSLSCADKIHSDQYGMVGDITASRKALHGEPPYEKNTLKTVNVLYIEWFSTQNGRVVIEATHYDLTVHGDALWHITDELEAQRQKMVSNGMSGFMDRLQQSIEDGRDDTEDWSPMDEYEWERTLKESDKRTDTYIQLLEKYHDHPDQERIIAREMGWDHLEDLLDADECGVFDAEKEAQTEDDYPDLVPDPDTEGTDWIRTDDGDIRHPLAHRAFNMSIRLHHLIRDLGAEEDEGGNMENEALQILSFAAHMLSAKLAGALNSLGYDRDITFMAGMIVAQLKRALSHFNEAVHRLDALSRENNELQEKLAPYRIELFEIREEMLRLMERYRKMIG